jgi:hypothetical protein
MNETMSDAQVELVKVLFEQAVLDEQSAFTFKEIKSVFADLTTGHLNDMRTKGFIKNSGGSVNKWWITPKAVNFLGLEASSGKANKAIETNQEIDLIVVENVEAFNNSYAEITHCKTAQLAAALREANEVITKLAAENVELRDSLNKEAICEFKGYLLGDSTGASGLQLYSEDDRLVAFDTIDEAKANGFQSCLESAYDFEVYGLVKVGSFRSRTVVDWVGA